MALKSKFKTPEGHVDAYWRISDLRYNYDKPYGNEVDEEGNIIAPYEVNEAVTFSLEVLNWDTKEKYDYPHYMYEEGVGTYSIDSIPTGDASDLIKKAYSHLKTLERFADSEDC
tara:strand:- start:476 stop:817 length:342 start_codon:yes stop_codon:yes gene_type:complete